MTRGVYSSSHPNIFPRRTQYFSPLATRILVLKGPKTISDRVATMNMASKPFLGFARVEGGGSEVAVVTFEHNFTSGADWDSFLFTLLYLADIMFGPLVGL